MNKQNKQPLTEGNVAAFLQLNKEPEDDELKKFFFENFNSQYPDWLGSQYDALWEEFLAISYDLSTQDSLDNLVACISNRRNPIWFRARCTLRVFSPTDDVVEVRLGNRREVWWKCFPKLNRQLKDFVVDFVAQTSDFTQWTDTVLDGYESCVGYLYTLRDCQTSVGKLLSTSFIGGERSQVGMRRRRALESSYPLILCGGYTRENTDIFNFCHENYFDEVCKKAQSIIRRKSMNDSEHKLLWWYMCLVFHEGLHELSNGNVSEKMYAEQITFLLSFPFSEDEFQNFLRPEREIMTGDKMCRILDAICSYPDCFEMIEGLLDYFFRFGEYVDDEAMLEKFRTHCGHIKSFATWEEGVVKEIEKKRKNQEQAIKRKEKEVLKFEQTSTKIKIELEQYFAKILSLPT